MFKSGHLRQILRDRISHNLDTSAEGSSNTIITANIPPTVPSDADRQRQRLVAYALIIGFFAIPAAALLYFLLR